MVGGGIFITSGMAWRKSELRNQGVHCVEADKAEREGLKATGQDWGQV